MAKTLKSCAHCGSPAIFREVGGNVWVECLQCEIQTQIYLTQRNAKTSWNRRFKAPNPNLRVEE